MLVAVPVICAGCVGAAAGTTAREAGQLNRLLLSAGEVGAIVGASPLRVASSAEQMSDHSGAVADLGCLGTLYGAEEPVYSGSGWSAVRDEVLRDPGPGNQHWIEQAVVLFGSAGAAEKFFATSREQWAGCATAPLITTGTGTRPSIWNLHRVSNAGDALIDQDSEQQNTNGWACQHAMGVAANLVSEVFACGYSVTDEASRILDRILRNASG